jgi:hypothetical protein
VLEDSHTHYASQEGTKKRGDFEISFNPFLEGTHASAKFEVSAEQSGESLTPTAETPFSSASPDHVNSPAIVEQDADSGSLSPLSLTIGCNQSAHVDKSSSSSKLASAAVEDAVASIDLGRGKDDVVWGRPVHESDITQMIFLPESDVLFTSSMDSTLRVVSLERMETQDVLRS